MSACSSLEPPPRREVSVPLEYTLRQVSELTNTPLPTLRRWAFRDHILPIVHRGPTRRVRVTSETMRLFFGVDIW